MKDRLIFISAALESIELIETYTQGFDLATFLADRKTQDAVVRNLEIIGQALKDYGVDHLIEKSADLPWREMTGMRNVLAHNYLGVDPEMVWSTVQKDIQPLRAVLKQLLVEEP